jgi:hypothetical protein
MQHQQQQTSRYSSDRLSSANTGTHEVPGFVEFGSHRLDIGLTQQKLKISNTDSYHFNNPEGTKFLAKISPENSGKWY